MIEKVKRNIDFVQDGSSQYGDFGGYVEIREEGVLGFTEPFRFSWFLTIVGSEYFHVYLWIAKDFSWTQEFKSLSLFFGTVATLWCVVIFFNAFRVGNNDEVYSTVALFMWIFANYWWMTGEVHDDNYPDEPSIYEQRANESAIILLTAVCWLTVYYFVVIPFNLMPVSAEAIAAYDDGSYKPRFPFLKTFRQYENLHMYFWLLKDLFWNRSLITMWFIMLVPAVFLAGDFFFISAFCKNSVVDTVHYSTIFLWVCGNVTWALGEFFFKAYDEPIRIWHGSAEARKTARWYSSWILFASFLPIIMLYCVWIPLSLCGKLDNIGGDTEASDNDGSNPTDWFQKLPLVDSEINYTSVRRSEINISQSTSTTHTDGSLKTLKGILKVRSFPFAKTPVDKSSYRNKTMTVEKVEIPRNSSVRNSTSNRIRFNPVNQFEDDVEQQSVKQSRHHEKTQNGGLGHGLGSGSGSGTLPWGSEQVDDEDPCDEEDALLPA